MCLLSHNVQSEVRVYGDVTPSIQALLDPLLVQGTSQHASISVGALGLRQALKDTSEQQTIFAGFITRPQFYQVLATLPISTDISRLHPLFVDPNPLAQAHLARELLGSSASIGFLLSSQTRYLAPLIKKAGFHSRQLTHLTVRSVVTAMADFDALVLLPDDSLFNAHTLPSIIQSALRQRIILIGYSKNLVKSGVLISLDVRPQDYQRLMEQTILSRKPTSSHAPTTHITINQRLLRSFQLTTEPLSNALWEIEVIK